MSRAKQIARIPTLQRVELARAKIHKVVDRTSGLLALAEQNRLVVYSKVLSEQVPRSFAANAFNVFQRAMHNQEVVQLFALWDAPDDTLQQNSIRLVYELIDDDAVVHALAKESGASRPLTPVGEKPEEQRAREALQELRARVPKVVQSDEFRALKNMRDKFLAHALDATRAEGKGAPIRQARYGDEKSVLQETTEIVQELYLWVSGIDFDLAENRQMHARHAAELWENCTFTINGR